MCMYCVKNCLYSLFRRTDVLSDGRGNSFVDSYTNKLYKFITDLYSSTIRRYMHNIVSSVCIVYII